MAISNNRFVRVPPDSTGKRVGVGFTLYVDFNNLIGTFEDKLGQEVSGLTSTTVGTLIEVIRASAATVGTIGLYMEPLSESDVFTLGEDLYIGGAKIAEAASTGTPVYHNHSITVGGSNPAHKQRVDQFGAASIGFYEGNPQLDAFGKLRVTNDTLIKSYDSTKGRFSEEISFNFVGSATASLNTNESSVILSNTTANGDKASYTTDLYHTYIPGQTSLIATTVQCGDTGKSALVRRWGYFDDDDGLFFELSGSVLYVVQRSSTSGAPVDTKVAQSTWNVDSLDGSSDPVTNISRETLDVSKLNVYFIDFQWLGAGKTRFGVYQNGQRLVAHQFLNEGTNTVPYMKRGNLPLRWEQENIGTTPGSSDLRVVCSAVYTEGNFEPVQDLHSFKFDNVFITSSTDYHYIAAIRSADTVGTIDNRTWGGVNNLTGYSLDGTVELVVYNNNTLSSPVWTSSTSSVVNSALDFCQSPSVSQTGSVTWTDFCTANNKFEIVPHDNLSLAHQTFFHRKADLTQEPNIWVIAAKKVGTTNATMSIALNWFEVH